MGAPAIAAHRRRRFRLWLPAWPIRWDIILMAHGEDSIFPPAYRGSDKRMEQNRYIPPAVISSSTTLRPSEIEWCQVADVLYRVHKYGLWNIRRFSAALRSPP